VIYFLSYLDFIPNLNTMKAFFSTSLLILFAVANAADKNNFKDHLAEFQRGNHGVHEEVRMIGDTLIYADM
jgi:hypothetical protein